MMSTEDEIVNLKAQIKSLSSLYDILLKNNSKLRSEKSKLQQTVLDFQSRYNESLKEIKRYRETLQTIANGDLAPSLIKEMYIDQAYQTIAEKALKGGK